MTLRATTRFETGLGKEARVEHGDVYVVADAHNPHILQESHVHFHVRVSNPSAEPVSTVLHAKYPRGSFLRTVWLAGRIFCRRDGDDWLHWYQVPVADVTWQLPRGKGAPGWIHVKLALNPEEALFVSTFPTWPHRDFRRWLRPLARNPRVTVTVMGRTAGGRDIHVLSITDPAVPDAGKERALILAGVHGSEYTGQFAARGMVEWLLSDDPLVRLLLQHYVFDVVVQMSVDGAVLNSYHNADDVDWHHDCREAWEGRAAAPEARAAVSWIRSHGLPAYYLEIHGAWQGNPNWRPYPLHIGVVTAGSDLMRFLWRRDALAGRGTVGEGASGALSWNFHGCWPLAHSGHDYRYPEREVTFYDLLPNDLGVPTFTIEILPGCGPLGNLDYDFGYLNSGRAALEAFLGSMHMLRRESEYLVNGLPVLDGSLLLDYEVLRQRKRYSARLWPAETAMTLLSPRKKLFDRRSRCRAEQGREDAGVTVDLRTAYLNRKVPYIYACAKASDLGMARSRMSLLLRQGTHGSHQRLLTKKQGGTILGLWLCRGKKEGLGFFALPRGFGHERKDVTPRFHRQQGLPLELRISSAHVRRYQDAHFGLINQPVVLVPNVTEKELAYVVQLVAHPCRLETRRGTVIDAEDWSYRVAPVAGKLDLTLSNPLARSRDLALEVERVTDPAALQVLLPGARRWRRASHLDGWELYPRSGKLVVYIPSLQARERLRIRVGL
jgi:hypothetical protein